MGSLAVSGDLGAARLVTSVQNAEAVSPPAPVEPGTVIEGAAGIGVDLITGPRCNFPPSLSALMTCDGKCQFLCPFRCSRSGETLATIAVDQVPNYFFPQSGRLADDAVGQASIFLCSDDS